MLKRKLIATTIKTIGNSLKKKKYNVVKFETEILYLILSYVPEFTLMKRLSLVCKKFHNYLTGNRMVLNKVIYRPKIYKLIPEHKLKEIVNLDLTECEIPIY